MSLVNDSANKGGDSSVIGVVASEIVAPEASTEAITTAAEVKEAAGALTVASQGNKGRSGNKGSEGDIGLGVACGGKGGAGGLSGSGKGTPAPCMCRGIGGGDDIFAEATAEAIPEAVAEFIACPLLLDGISLDFGLLRPLRIICAYSSAGLGCTIDTRFRLAYKEAGRGGGGL